MNNKSITYLNQHNFLLQQGAYCGYNPVKAVARVTGYVTIRESGAAAVAAMKDAVANGGSISVSVDASQAFSEYT